MKSYLTLAAFCLLAVTASCARDKSLSLYLPQPSNGLTAAAQGVTCNVHDLPQYSNNTTLPGALVGNPIVGTFILPNFSVGDSPSANGFPGLPKEIQDKVGLDGYFMDCYGLLMTESSGQYIFKVLSDDGMELYINNNLTISAQGEHAPRTDTSASTKLNKGLNRINVTWFQGPATQIALELRMSGPNQPEQVIPASQFFTEGTL